MSAEGPVVRAVIRAVNLSGLAYVWRVNSGGRVGRVHLAPAGCPDVIGWTRLGRFVGLECKRPKGGETSDEQLEWQGRMATAGCVGAVVTSPQEAISALMRAEAWKR